MKLRQKDQSTAATIIPGCQVFLMLLFREMVLEAVALVDRNFILSKLLAKEREVAIMDFRSILMLMISLLPIILTI